MDQRHFRTLGLALAHHRAGSVLALAPSALDRAPKLARQRFAGARIVRADGSPLLPDVAPPSGEAPDVRAERPPGGVAIIGVDGVLEQRGEAYLCGYSVGYDDIECAVRSAAGDERIAAIVLRLNSPGGDMAGLDECARRITAVAAEAGKPLLAHVDELAGSAAYRLACCAETIYGPPSAMVGSVGTILVHVEESQALKAEGITVTLIRDPPGKAAGHPAEPISDVARARYEDLVARSTESFVEAVAFNRGIPPEAIRALDGAMLQGEAAIAAGLMDEIASLEDVIALAMERGVSAQTPPNDAAALAAKGTAMRPSAALLSVLPDLTEAASPAAVEAAALPMLRFAAEAMAIASKAGAKSFSEAAGVLQAHAVAASEMPELRAAVRAVERVREEEDRKAALEACVHAGADPALVFAFSEGPTGERVRTASAWAASQSVEQLRAFATTFAKTGIKSPERKPAPIVAQVASSELATRAAASGLSPEIRAQAEAVIAKAMMNAASAAVGE